MIHLLKLLLFLLIINHKTCLAFPGYEDLSKNFLLSKEESKIIGARGASATCSFYLIDFEKESIEQLSIDQFNYSKNEISKIELEENKVHIKLLDGNSLSYRLDTENKSLKQRQLHEQHYTYIAYVIAPIILFVIYELCTYNTIENPSKALVLTNKSNPNEFETVLKYRVSQRIPDLFALMVINAQIAADDFIRLAKIDQELMLSFIKKMHKVCDKKTMCCKSLRDEDTSAGQLTIIKEETTFIKQLTKAVKDHQGALFITTLSTLSYFGS
jgi:hypothetical protein